MPGFGDEMVLDYIKSRMSTIPKVFIYGAGCWGNLFYQYCTRHMIEIAGYIVTARSSRDITNGMSVFTLDEYMLMDDNYPIVVCVYYPESIKNLLDERGISDYCVLTLPELIEMSFEMSRDFFFCDHSEYINIAGKKYINPYINGTQYFWEFFTDFIDIIMPTDMDNYNFINEGPYEYGEVQIESNDIVFDLGACIGVFSQMAVNKGAFVYAFECSPRNYKYLKKTENAWEDNCKCVPLGIADYNGEHSFYTGGASLGWDGFKKMPDLSKEITVNVVTLDSFVQEHGIKKVDFIKANIEGAERLMLDGAKETIRRFHPKLSLRTNHYPDDPEVLENKIKSIDERYHVVHKWKQLYAWI